MLFIRFHKCVSLFSWNMLKEITRWRTARGGECDWVDGPSMVLSMVSITRYVLCSADGGVDYVLLGPSRETRE